MLGCRAVRGITGGASYVCVGQWAFRGESWLGNGEYSSVILCHSAPLNCHDCDNHEQSRYDDEKTLKLFTKCCPVEI